MKTWLILGLLVVVAPIGSATTLLPRELALTLRKVEVSTGKEVWNVAVPAGLDPYGVEVFDERVVTYYYRRERRVFPSEHQPPASEVFFFDSKTGKAAPAFDTRDFVRTRDDPLRATSAWSIRPALDVRKELHLANGWISYGLGRMSWDGNRRIHFFQETWNNAFDDSHRDWSIRWTLEFPEGAGGHGVSAWESTVLYRQSGTEGDVAMAKLVAVVAGEKKPSWEFRLPAEVPTVTFAEVVYPDLPRPSRYIEYAVGKADIFVFGNGFLFALDPKNGRIRWQQAIATDDVMRRATIRFDHGYPQESPESGEIVLTTHRLRPPNVLAITKAGAGSQPRILRTDLNESQLVVVYDGFVYFFTEVQLPGKEPPPRL